MLAASGRDWCSASLEEVTHHLDQRKACMGTGTNPGGVEMKIMRMLASALALAVGVQTSVAFAGGTSPVVGSYAFEDLGQGGWAGGPLYADGTVGGGGSFSYSNG